MSHAVIHKQLSILLKTAEKTSSSPRSAEKLDLCSVILFIFAFPIIVITKQRGT